MLSRIANLGIAGIIPVPKAQVATAITANSGTWTVHVSATEFNGKPMFRIGQMLNFWDGAGSPYAWGTSGSPDFLLSGEEFLQIAAVDPVGNIITVDSTGIEYNGFQQSHSINAWVMANLALEVEVSYQDQLNTRFPVFAVSVTDQADTHQIGGRGAGTAHNWTPELDVYIEVSRNLIASPEGSISAQVYANRQRAATRADMNAIQDAIETPGGPPTLAINGFNQAVQVGPRIRRSWRQVIVSRDTDQFTVGMTVPVTGKGASF